MPKTIGAVELRKMVESAAVILEKNRAKVDALNVFPVPDGDTGTNMSLTIQSAVHEMKMCQSNRLEDLCSAISKGALKGARGNSGVILSQLFRGMCAEIREHDDISIRTFAKAMQNSTKIAYSAVSKPKEGTILTVARGMSEFAASSASKYRDFSAFVADIIKRGEESLEHTPELLPVLKKAGVVDSGGMGLLFVYRGFLSALNGEEVSEEIATPETAKTDEDIFGDNSEIINLDLGEIVFAYCTEFFVINLKPQTTLADIDRLKERLMTIGDCVICIGDLEMIKVHVHTNTPGVALNWAVELGELGKVKIENMLEQNRALRAKREAEKKEMGMLSVCVGEGIAAIFKDLLIDATIEGGQTMNPSAEDIANAVQKINAEHVFVFPNNKNIILAAEQAKSLVEKRVIHVIPTKNIPQGISSVLAFQPEASVEENITNMLHAMDNVRAGQVTYAVRSANVNGFKLKEGDIIGLDDKKVLSKSDNIEDATVRLIERLRDSSHELITLYYGKDVKEEEAEALCARIAEKFPDFDVDFHFGGQPVYYYLVALE